MLDHSRPLSDRHLDTTTTMSCQREPASYAFLCANAVAAPELIDRLNFDIASADFHRGRASVWATLEMRGEARAETGTCEASSLLGFDEGFLRPFTRAVLEASATRVPYRMSIRPDPERPDVPRVVDYVRSAGGTPITELIVIPYDQVLAVGVAVEGTEAEETLFQLPRTDTFLRAFTRMAHLADAALRETLGEMARLGRGRDSEPEPESPTAKPSQRWKATSTRPNAP
jgi:hypothetical protein